MIFKTTGPVLTESDENLDKILEYVSDIKTECEVKLTYIEQILATIKEKIEYLNVALSAPTSEAEL